MTMIGVDYFPEHWPRERWPIDVAMMKEAGLTVVRIAEFTWSALEPQPGVYDWSWLDDAVKVIADAGLKVYPLHADCLPPALDDRTRPLDSAGSTRPLYAARWSSPLLPASPGLCR